MLIWRVLQTFYFICRIYKKKKKTHMIFCYQLLENAADKFISSAIRLKKTSKKNSSIQFQINEI